MAPYLTSITPQLRKIGKDIKTEQLTLKLMKQQEKDILSALLAKSFLNEGNTDNLAIAQEDKMANLAKTQQDLPAPGS